jgi:hypothetical protein
VSGSDRIRLGGNARDGLWVELSVVGIERLHDIIITDASGWTHGTGRDPLSSAEVRMCPYAKVSSYTDGVKAV